MTASTARYEGPPWDHVAGDDYVVVLDPDDDVVAESTTSMRLWSDLIVEIRAGETRESDLVLTSQGEEPTIILDGYTFPGDDGLVVPETDLTVPVLSIVILAERVPASLIAAGKAYRTLYFELEVLDEGVRSTKFRSRPWRLWNELAVRSDG